MVFLFLHSDGGGTATFGGLFSPSSSSPKQPPPPKQEDTGGDEIVVPPEEIRGFPHKKTGSLMPSLDFGGDEPTFSETSGGSRRRDSRKAAGESAVHSSLRQIVNVPVAGALAFPPALPLHSARLVRCMERATGHIYDIDPRLIKTRGQTPQSRACTKRCFLETATLSSRAILTATIGP